MRLILALLCGAALVACTAPTPSARLHSNVIWDRSDPWFGGFSGIELGPQGQTATLITDKGRLVRASLTRSTTGQITAIQLLSTKTIKAAGGTPLTDLDTDAEGLAIATPDIAYVSFEQDHRVMQLDLRTGQTNPLPQLPLDAIFDPNKGLEALAVHPNGTLYAVSEKRPSGARPFDLLHLENGTWRVSHALPQQGRFVPVGADFDPGGRLYLLERATTPLGFRSRIRRFDLTANGLRQNTLITTRAGQFDNLEGLSIWTDPQGRTRLTMVSDDNFSRLLRTQIVEYSLP